MTFYLDNHFSTNAYFNLSLEEVLFDKIASVFYLWQNENAVIVGRNQNTKREINEKLVKQKNIQVVRRLSGGGAVYHDLGNLNFTFITKRNSDYFDYLLECLIELGFQVELSERNDLLIKDKKISGLAAYQRGDKELLHGTLLFNSNLELLDYVLTPSKEKYKEKGINSVRQRVANLSEFSTISFETLRTTIQNKFIEKFSLKPLKLDNSLLESIWDLYTNKYITDKWNYNKKLKPVKAKRFRCGDLQISYQKEGNLYNSFKIFGDFFSQRDIRELEQALENKTIEQIETELNQIDSYILGIKKEEFLEMLY